jgi:SNF family Na+-dependent transporter
MVNGRCSEKQIFSRETKQNMFILTVLSPFFLGIGIAMVVITSLCSVYYNVIMAWAFFYMFDSFRSTVPWKDCNNTWNTEYCR